MWRVAGYYISVTRNDMLSPDALKKIDREIAKYPPDQKQSAVMSALAIAQDEQGWLATDTMDFVAQYLGMPPVAVYEVATFYTMYNLKPAGQATRSRSAPTCRARCRAPSSRPST